MELTEADRKMLETAYQRAKERHERHMSRIISFAHANAAMENPDITEALCREVYSDGVKKAGEFLRRIEE